MHGLNIAYNVSQIAVRFNDGYVLLPAGAVNLVGFWFKNEKKI